MAAANPLPALQNGPSNALLAKVAQREADRNRWFDRAIARTSILTTRAPAPPCPAAPAAAGFILPPTHVPQTPGWNVAAAAAGQANYPPQCNDRVNHAGLPGASDCSSDWNPGLANLPPLGLDVRWYRRRACRNHAAGHGRGFLQCRFCSDHTKQMRWYRRIEARIASAPQTIASNANVQAGNAGINAEPIENPHANGVLTPGTASTLWRTRLCIDCEFVEKLLCLERARDVIEADELELPGYMYMREHCPPHNNTQLGYPYSTCVCYGVLDGAFDKSNCAQCCHNGSCDDHDERLIIRQQNDYWLRHITIRNGVIVRAPDSLVRKRAANGSFRACRCGAEIRYHSSRVAGVLVVRQPEVLLCLGCEGVVHVPGPWMPNQEPDLGNRKVRQDHWEQVDRANAREVNFPLRRAPI